jgi:hypothetical protein
MRHGIHRGFKSSANKEPKRAWVADDQGKAGEWLSEADYRAAGHSPDFDNLPHLVVEILSAGLADMDDLPESDREFVRDYLERGKNA